MLELLLTIILFPILELVVSIITDKFADKVKWKPFEKHYKESLSKNSKTFSMIREPNGKIVLWLGVGDFCFFLGFRCNLNFSSYSLSTSQYY